MKNLNYLMDNILYQIFKQLSAIKNQGIKQVEDLKVLKPEENQQDLESIEELFPKEMRTNEIRSGLKKIKRGEDIIVRHHLKDKANKKFIDFQKFQAIKSFCDSTLSGKIIISEADEEQRNLSNNILNFNDKARSKSKEDSKKKMIFMNV